MKRKNKNSYFLWIKVYIPKEILEEVSSTAEDDITDFSVIITMNLDGKFLFCSIKRLQLFKKSFLPKIDQELSSIFPSYILFLQNVP